MKRILFIVMAIIEASPVNAQKVENSSYTTQSGERVLRLELVVPVDRAKAWELFTKDEQLKKWIAPLAHIELKTGGFILTNYDSTKALSDTSSIRLRIINYIEKELLTLKVTLNNNFALSLRNEDGNLQELIQFIDAGNGKTKIISSMMGWGSGADWDKTYNFFVKGNEWTYEEINKLFK
jgi:Activator of Hsp90 ATPase homolog 1-like protein